MESDPSTVDAASLQQQLSENGKAAVYGIQFDLDKAELRKDSAETLKAISQLLEANGAMKLYIVGHTDDSGSEARNLDLFKRRAKAVVEELVGKYGVAEERLAAFGAGPYAPVARNDTETGKAKNRRVEPVKRMD